MDMDITIERLMNDLEGVLSQINDIVAKKDIPRSGKQNAPVCGRGELYRIC